MEKTFDLEKLNKLADIHKNLMKIIKEKIENEIFKKHSFFKKKQTIFFAEKKIKKTFSEFTFLFFRFIEFLNHTLVLIYFPATIFLLSGFCHLFE